MRYPKYKPTGIAWLPEVPEGWEMVKVGYCFDENGSGTTPSSGSTDYYDGSINWVQSGDLHGDDIYVTKKTVTEKALQDYSLRIFQPPFVCMAMYGASIANVSVVRISACTNQACCVLAKNRATTDLDYLYRCLGSESIRQVLLLKAQGGTQPNINRGDILSTRIPLPPLPTQRAIVAYLDEKCGKVDRLVVAKEKEAALLKELKQSMIAEAVTHGVRPKRRLVLSGIPWLPEVPEGWEVKRAKYLFQKEQRPVRAGDEIVTCFRDGEVTLRKNRRISGFTEATDYSHYQHICAGDLVIHQMDAFAGSCGVSDSDGMGTPVLSVCTPKNDRLDVRYFAAVVRLMGLNGFIQSLYRGIRERSSDFRFETFAKQVLPVPSLAEQREIVAHVETRAAKIDAAVKGLEREVAALKEYKQRLIADVVTGQRKVA